MTVVRTTAGLIRGTSTLTRRAEVESYLGVPFAEPPTGSSRFRRPEPVKPWEGERDARRFAPAAPQNPDPVLAAGGFWQPPYDEGLCLNLNIWTPGADTRGRPVLVWVHGGAYVNGSNSTGYNNGAELAAALDAVVVSINYRLGALGFLYLGHLLGEEYADSGNLALFDLLLGLEWVRDNIAAFGGSAERVTLFGESAGGAAVGTLLGLPAAQGLFSRAIVQSGTAERARSVAESVNVTAEFLAAADVPETDAARLLEMPIADLLAAQGRLVEAHRERTVGLPLPFIPTIDGRLLPQSPLELIASGVGADVDLLAGTNLNEASFFTFGADGSVDVEENERRLQALFASDFTEPEVARSDYEEALRETLGREPDATEVLDAYLSDKLYRQPTNRLLDARARVGARSFAYLFTWTSPLRGGALGACHALEVPFVFRQLHRIDSASLVGEQPPVELSEWISGVWVEFARRGSPRFPALPDWPRYDTAERSTMELNTRPGLLADPRGALREFWSVEGAHE